MRWATQRVKGDKAANKRRSIFNRHLSRRGREEKKQRASADSESVKGQLEYQTADEEKQEQADDTSAILRRVYFNTPLPDFEQDEHGKPLQRFARNKIRTAKYTPLSFVPKNLYFQFHNIANIYFFIVIILGVCLG